MDRKQIEKFHGMLNSGDSEMATYAMKILEVTISFQEYKELRGISLKGASFFPHRLKAQSRYLKRVLVRKEMEKKSKFLNQQTINSNGKEAK